MTPYRTAMADYLTILTALSTILTGLYALNTGGAVMDSPMQEGYWDVYLRHAIAIIVTVMGMYFFLDQSIKAAQRVVSSGSSALPKWLVYGFFYFGGMAFFMVFQIMLQSKMFEEIAISYFIVTLVIWLSVTIPLTLLSNRKKSGRVKGEKRR